MKKISALIVPFFYLFIAMPWASATEPGVTSSQILIGSSLALEGPASFLGIQTNHGMEAYIKSMNDAGGVNGRKIRVISYNDSYEPLPCVWNTKKLINEDHV